MSSEFSAEDNWREMTVQTPAWDGNASEFDYGPGNVPFKGATIAQGADYCGLSPEMVPRAEKRR